MVILSRDLRTGESVAVKVIDKSKLTDEVERRDLMLEVDVMNRIGIGSLNCIWLYDTFEDAQRVYMVCIQSCTCQPPAYARSNKEVHYGPKCCGSHVMWVSSGVAGACHILC